MTETNPLQLLFFWWECSPLTATNFKIALVETVHCLVQNLHLISDVLGVLSFYGERDNRKGESLEKHGDMINVNVFLSSYCHSSERAQTAWRLCVGWHDARCLCPTLGIPSVVLALLTRPRTSWRNLGPLYCCNVQRKEDRHDKVSILKNCLYNHCWGCSCSSVRL